MNRRDFIKLGGLGTLAATGAKWSPEGSLLSAQEATKADLTVQIAPVTVELAPTVKTRVPA